jgi:uncharacterized membrane protein YedE/YeeE
LIGGLMIGIAAAALLLFNGRVAGISGVIGQMFAPASLDRNWRLAFLGGLIAGGFVLRLLGVHGTAVERSIPVLAIAGLLVGYGTRLGNGCTSGHGVCGISRGSKRSIVATVTFMAVAMVVVFVRRHAFGGVDT